MGGRVFVISGPSGSGKTSVVARLRRRMPRLVRSVSVTTRAPRPGERQGRDYQFISTPQFRRMRRSGRLLEWAAVHGAAYGTPRAPILRALARGRDAVLSIDVQGARVVRRLLNDRAVLIFLLPPSQDQLRRRLMRRRTETPAALRQRMAAVRREVACARWYDYRLANDQLQHIVQRIAAIIAAHRSAPQRKGS